MNKALLGFLAGAVVATGVYFVASHRAKPAAPEVQASAPATTPVVAPAPEPNPAPAVTPEPAPPPLKSKTAKRIQAPVTHAALEAKQPEPIKIEQAKNDPPPPAVVAPEVPTARPSEPPPPPPPAPAKEPEPAPQPRTVTIPSGTTVRVRLGEMIASDKSKPGDVFNATLDQPLVVDDLVIAEKGARVLGKITDVQEAGRVKGVARLSLELTSINTADGQKVSIRTTPFEKIGPESKAEDAKKVGIGAAIGAAIGAIAGGGKGAAIGAGAGGAAGGGVVAATRGKPAVLENEAQIAFRIEQPVTITERR